MKCPKCQFENAQGIKFCGECGCDLSQETESTLKPDRQPRSYTPKFLADKILSTRSAVEGEHKQVTVLFADVVGFTSISEKLNPEEVHHIMDGCFKILMDEIHEHQGTINQFTGDGVMALFGAPLAIEDHAQSACLAALKIQEALKGYRADLKTSQGLDFKMRIGINSGPVVVGSIGDDLRMDYTAVGDTTNLAARMESMAKPGTVLVSPNTYQKVSRSFEFHPLGDVIVKGKQKPLAIYELVSHKIHRSSTGLARQIYASMVGRDEDLNRLTLQVMKAVNGKGSVVNIIGEAGIGKSRLMVELKKQEVMKQVTLLEGKAISMGRNLSYHPIIDLLKQWAHIKEDDIDTVSFDKLKNAVRQVCLEHADEVLPFVATLMGMKLSDRYTHSIQGIEGEALQKHILKNVKDLLTFAAEQTPLIIVMEDLHWADTSSIELLESLYRLTETRRILFVNVFRPEHRETGDRIMDTLKNTPSLYSVDIKLHPLDEKFSETLIHNIMNIKGVPYKIKNQIIYRSGGNPFFIEEVVRSFIDQGAVVKKNDAFEATDKINTMVIPHTINDVLMARIDRLEEGTRNLVKLAAVIGRNFFYRILSEVSNTVENVEDIDTRLSYLKDIQLIRDRKRLEELEYLFKHALAQEAAYESILHQKRKTLHLKVAESIEKVFKEKLHEFYGMLAFHYTQAEDEEKIEEYLIKAGEEALKSSASSEALHYFQEALHLYLKKYGATTDPEKIAMFEKNIAQAYFNKGQFIEAEEYFNKVLEFYGVKRVTLSPYGIMKLVFGFLFFMTGLYLPFIRWKKTPSKKDNEIADLFFKNSECLVSIDPAKCFIYILSHSKRYILLDISKLTKGVESVCTYSTPFSYGGISFGISRKILEAVKEKVNKEDAYADIVHQMNFLIYSVLSGDWNRAGEYDNDLVNKNLKAIGVIVPAYIGFHRMIQLEQGRYADTKALIEKVSEIGNVYEHEFSIVAKYYGNSYLLLKYRKLRQALVELDEAIAYIQKTDFAFYLIAMYSIKASVQILSRNISEAEDYLYQAGKINAEAHPAPIYLSYYLNALFKLHLHYLKTSIQTGHTNLLAKHKKAALKTGTMAVKNVRKVTPDRVEIYRLMGIFYWLVSKQKKALKWWAKSIKEGEYLEARLELSRTYFEVGKRLLEPQSKYKSLNNISAEEYLKKAKAMFEEMDLQWDLDKLEKISER